ncbi:2Fe-2S iron-sulfur cluster-binding protein [Roseobacter sp. HKCCA0434]|uniref:2Fe-2S iron-sulfur cluster-binding protein n=1 Tax=Roseobacter sp. HKCCA0434 TaxID=3079297 RepID=UPI002905BA3D|nr:reductive dehalogenase domain-containing protein [Roseobacter sp. HKCCA0434]
MRLRSYSDRPMHLGPYPLEAVPRGAADLSRVPPDTVLRQPDTPLGRAIGRYQAMLDTIRDGSVKAERAVIPDDPVERANHLKSFAYFCDASVAGVCTLDPEAFRAEPQVNPAVGALAEELRTRQTSTLAAGIDVIMAELRESAATPPGPCDHHGHALVYLYAHPREARDAPGEWMLEGAAEARSTLRAAETGAVLASYIRLLGYEARAHHGTASDVHLGRLAVAAGLARVEDGRLVNPWFGERFAIGCVTTTMSMQADAPLAHASKGGARWWLGDQAQTALNRDPFARRDFTAGPHPFERLKRVDDPTTYIDEPRVPRVPKRADMFSRALFGDMGRGPQENAKNGNYVRKSASAFAFRRALGALVLLQDGPAQPKDPRADEAERNAEWIKAASYFLGADAVGLSRCPDWAYYSHDAKGDPLPAYHVNAISMIIDQGHETMEGASGDDWIACAQSMRAYLRFSLLGGVIAEAIREMGYEARVHSVIDGEVLQPPLLLLAGLGEVSRIGEVILNPFLGPRLKSGAITTNMPMTHDRPIDFGLQRFCEACNKCARECPSGAITAGPKKMFNGYEIWKSDSQKCTTYRIGTEGGAMCGRCMKTCPWNLEGLFAEAPFRWAAMNVPGAARHLAALDDRLGRGNVNPVKKWWWDLEMESDGPYRPPASEVNTRHIAPERQLRHEDQTLAVYPAELAPPPWPFPYPMDREAGIAAYEALIDAVEYRRRLAAGEDPSHKRPDFGGEAPVLPLILTKVEPMTAEVTKYEFRRADGGELPEWSAGAHLDIVVAPEFLRQYSMSGDPADRSVYQIGVLREEAGRGGSALMHRIFTEGRRVFVSRPINHFPLVEEAPRTLLMGGGIGVTPMIAMAHRLHALGREFELHYSCRSRAQAGFLADLQTAPWADRVRLWISDEERADLDAVVRPSDGAQLYTCGPDRYMQAVLDAARRAGWPEADLHREYFLPPVEPDYEDHPFTLILPDKREVAVSESESAADALLAAGVKVDVKCADGLCGTCKCTVRDGEVEHRDHVLSAAQREREMILCRSRAAVPGGRVAIGWPG